VIAAGAAGRRGARCVPLAGVCAPTSVDGAASICGLAGVALGGRASRFGPVLGAIAVGYGRSTLSETVPTQWTYFLGALFIVVVVLLPGGVASLWTKAKLRRSSSGPPVTTSSAIGSAPEKVIDQASPGVST